jgi:hypothetical protein
MLYKLWKQDGRLDEWRTANSWRVLCELYAKLIGLLLQHWLIILFAGLDEQRSLVKLARGASVIPAGYLWKLWQGTARFTLPYKVSNGACVQAAR